MFFDGDFMYADQVQAQTGYDMEVSAFDQLIASLRPTQQNHSNMNIVKIDYYHPRRIERLTWVVPYVSPNRVWVSGGALRTLYNPGEQVNDYDLFFTDQSALDHVLTRLQQDGWKKTFECPKKELFTFYKHNIKLQCIAKRFYSDAEDLLNSFDFHVTQQSWDGRDFYIAKEAIRSIKSKKLTVHNITYPVASLNRMMKYRQYGYYVPENTLRDIVQMISSRSFDEEQMALYVD
jgi:hypothetical protein